MSIVPYILAGLIIFSGILFGPFETETTSMWCLGLILLFGIPHGAVDHRVHFSVSKDSNIYNFIGKYLAIAFLYAILWVLLPTVALSLFLLVSSYHFGQELLEDNKIKDIRGLAIAAGVFIVFGPLIWHYIEAKAFLEIIISSEILPTLERNSFHLIACFILIGFLIAITTAFVRNKILRSQAQRLFLFAAIISLLNIFLSLIISFTVYFILFHSLNAFKHQFLWLKKRYQQYSLRKFLLDLIGFSLLAIIGIVALLWIIEPKNTIQLVTYFFMLTSIITLPHAITLDQFYRLKSNPRLSSELK